jgi:hypothetical protein
MKMSTSQFVLLLISVPCHALVRVEADSETAVSVAGKENEIMVLEDSAGYAGKKLADEDGQTDGKDVVTYDNPTRARAQTVPIKENPNDPIVRARKFLCNQCLECITSGTHVVLPRPLDAETSFFNTEILKNIEQKQKSMKPIRGLRERVVKTFIHKFDNENPKETVDITLENFFMLEWCNDGDLPKTFGLGKFELPNTMRCQVRNSRYTLFDYQTHPPRNLLLKNATSPDFVVAARPFKCKRPAKTLSECSCTEQDMEDFELQQSSRTRVDDRVFVRSEFPRHVRHTRHPLPED